MISPPAIVSEAFPIPLRTQWYCRDAGVTNWQMIAPYACFDKEMGRIDVPLLHFAEFGNDLGYITDYASIPQFAWTLIGSPERFARAAVPHDWLYRVRMLPDGTILTRKDCDELLYRLVIADGHHHRTAWAIYKAVRIGGGIAAWNKHGPLYLPAVTPINTTEDFAQV